MSAAVETLVVALAVGGALAFVAVRSVRALRGRKPACCSGGDAAPEGSCPDAQAGTAASRCGGCPFASNCGS